MEIKLGESQYIGIPTEIICIYLVLTENNLGGQKLRDICEIQNFTQRWNLAQNLSLWLKLSVEGESQGPAIG